MPWNQQGGGGPWGQGPRQTGPQPPNLEELLRRGQDRFRGAIPGGGNRRIIILIALVVIGLWFASGFYRVQSDEQGVVLRFGEVVRTSSPGLHYHLPVPIESVDTPKVTRINRVDVGFRGVSELGRRTTSVRDLPEESLMLTGDENIVDIDFSVFWIIKDAQQYLFNIAGQEANVKAVSESAMREVIGKTPIQLALSEGRAKVEIETRDLAQKILDDYGSGISLTEIKLQKVDPPSAVIDSFRDVQRARADMERLRNEAEAYANDIIPRARGEAEKMRQEAEAYREEVVRQAEGDAERFLSVYREYARAKEVTTRRIYLETMERIFNGAQKVIIDSASSGSGVVPYLPLPELKKRQEDTQ
tara:strand:- start:433 stop:1512 length:1080 start_codon:yes stop_codon:yes gene_type:complete